MKQMHSKRFYLPILVVCGTMIAASTLNAMSEVSQGLNGITQSIQNLTAAAEEGAGGEEVVIKPLKTPFTMLKEGDSKPWPYQEMQPTILKLPADASLWARARQDDIQGIAQTSLSRAKDPARFLSTLMEEKDVKGNILAKIEDIYGKIEKKIEINRDVETAENKLKQAKKEGASPQELSILSGQLLAATLNFQLEAILLMAYSQTKDEIKLSKSLFEPIKLSESESEEEWEQKYSVLPKDIYDLTRKEGPWHTQLFPLKLLMTRLPQIADILEKSMNVIIENETKKSVAGTKAAQEAFEMIRGAISDMIPKKDINNPSYYNYFPTALNNLAQRVGAGSAMSAEYVLAKNKEALDQINKNYLDSSNIGASFFSEALSAFNHLDQASKDKAARPLLETCFEMFQKIISFLPDIEGERQATTFSNQLQQSSAYYAKVRSQLSAQEESANKTLIDKIYTIYNTAPLLKFIGEALVGKVKVKSQDDIDKMREAIDKLKTILWIPKGTALKTISMLTMLKQLDKRIDTLEIGTGSKNIPTSSATSLGLANEKVNNLINSVLARRKDLFDGTSLDEVVKVAPGVKNFESYLNLLQEQFTSLLHILDKLKKPEDYNQKYSLLMATTLNYETLLILLAAFVITPAQYKAIAPSFEDIIRLVEIIDQPEQTIGETSRLDSLFAKNAVIEQIAQFLSTIESEKPTFFQKEANQSLLAIGQLRSNFKNAGYSQGDIVMEALDHMQKRIQALPQQ